MPASPRQRPNAQAQALLAQQQIYSPAGNMGSARGLPIIRSRSVLFSLYLQHFTKLIDR